MTRHIHSLAEIAHAYEAIVFDQWGVLHNGSSPYRSSIAILESLKAQGVLMAVLSNSGKRTEPNIKRIAAMGFHKSLFNAVMTGGEALWRDMASGSVSECRYFAIEREVGDAQKFAEGLEIDLVPLPQAEAVLLMGLPDNNKQSDWRDVFAKARSARLPVYCSNPDRQSPRADGLAISPGALAYAYRERGGIVHFYGKPHKPVFAALESALGVRRLLMVGDSLEHDIAGAETAGWDSLLVRGGLHAHDFAGQDIDQALARLLVEKGCRPPHYTIEVLQ